MKPKISKIRAEKCNKRLKPIQLALLRGNPRRHKPIIEFIDKTRDAPKLYYDFLEELDAGYLTLREMKNRLRLIIKSDRDFLDPYLYLAELHYENKDTDTYAKLIYDSYLRALHMIADKNGNYPQHLDWGWVENRHIIRTLSNFALLQWEQGDIRLALEIYRKLLASSLNDNIGARYSILALRLGYNPNYERLFLTDLNSNFSIDAIKMDEWFKKYSKNFPEEFNAFNRYIKELYA